MTRSLSVFVSLLACSTVSSSQAAPASSLPTQFGTAKAVYLASAGSSGAGVDEKGAARSLYVATSKLLVNTHRYQIVSTPALAEMCMRVSLQSIEGDVTHGSSYPNYFFRLETYDTKTGMLLWTLDEDIRTNLRAKYFDKGVDELMTRVGADLESLAEGKLP